MKLLFWKYFLHLSAASVAAEAAVAMSCRHVVLWIVPFDLAVKVCLVAVPLALVLSYRAGCESVTVSYVHFHGVLLHELIEKHSRRKLVGRWSARAVYAYKSQRIPRFGQYRRWMSEPIIVEASGLGTTITGPRAILKRLKRDLLSSEQL